MYDVARWLLATAFGGALYCLPMVVCRADIIAGVPYTYPRPLTPNIKYRLEFRLYPNASLGGADGSVWDETIDAMTDGSGALRVCLGGVNAKPFPNTPTIAYLTVIAPPGYPPLPGNTLNPHESSTFPIPQNATIAAVDPKSVPASDATAAWTFYYTSDPYCQEQLTHFRGTPIFAARAPDSALTFFDFTRIDVGVAYVPQAVEVASEVLLRTHAVYRAHVLHSKDETGMTFDLTNITEAAVLQPVTRRIEKATGRSSIGLSVGAAFRTRTSSVTAVGNLSLPLSPWASLNIGALGVKGRAAFAYGISFAL